MNPKLAGMVLLAAGTLAATTLAARPALAVGAVVNHVALPPGTSIEACLQRGALAIASVGLRPLNTTRSAAWGEREGGRIYTIYCLPQNSVAIFVGAGNASADVSPDVTALMTAFRSGSGGGAPRK
ncbi:hypothetical protein EJV46_12635 [Roseococcus sp. SYP-B2431]|nr:hypothetical protein EJV46_12635 [Roseococcus sp. SYP-B2431]